MYVLLKYSPDSRLFEFPDLWRSQLICLLSDKMAVPTVSVEEKLKKFQLVCESKLRKTEILEKQHVKNDEILRGFQKDYLVQSEIARLNLDLAQAQFDLGESSFSYLLILSFVTNQNTSSVKHKEKRAKEEERHKVLQDET